MRWIGLTGSVGSGKTTVAEILRKSGFPVIHADQIAHQTLKSTNPGVPSVYHSVVQRLGTGVLDAAGEIDRRKLGQFVFQDLNLRQWLESLIHPQVQAEVLRQRSELSAQGHTHAIYEIPLLFEKGLEEQFDDIILVWSSPEIQRERLRIRNSWSDKEINQRLQSQWPLEKKIPHSSIIIQNDSSLKDLELKINEIIKKLDK